MTIEQIHVLRKSAMERAETEAGRTFTAEERDAYKIAWLDGYHCALCDATEVARADLVRAHQLVDKFIGKMGQPDLPEHYEDAKLEESCERAAAKERDEQRRSEMP